MLYLTINALNIPNELKSALIALNSDVKYRVRMGKDKTLSVEFLLITGLAQGAVLSCSN